MIRLLHSIFGVHLSIVVLAVLLALLAGCNSSANTYRDPPEFDWRPDQIMWENNIRNCRAQPQCNAADLFRRN